jgi:AAA+ ATPase superfamily predicted ATPase
VFIDRQRELKVLRDAADGAPALVVLSGRRRVGKSALLDAAFERRRVLSFQADEQDEQGQLELLADEASRLPIDVVGVRRGRYALVGSCKWRRRAGERVLDELIDARDRKGTASRARLVIFAREGFTDALLRRAANEDVQLIALPGLFEQDD